MICNGCNHNGEEFPPDFMHISEWILHQVKFFSFYSQRS
ncbi:hypothetical protein ADICYQ_0436 [Cyclobacterium qasimii M12-11B]|uniref:Uncharacterized protein n=1 Tax=Cyclobacterium qasimii M12-11B TaxID=641524 RepID=S7X5J7_9BACT|nr:hypothetical protein ADICYQ_0436 [Cyclobacterium qasimii M12-11B]